MSEKILQLKKLNAAYIAALEYDRCPSIGKTKSVADMFSTGISRQQLSEALLENEGRRPDEIASSMSHLITELETTNP